MGLIGLVMHASGRYRPWRPYDPRRARSIPSPGAYPPADVGTPVHFVVHASQERQVANRLARAGPAKLCACRARSWAGLPGRTGLWIS
jgi:hypothetical protein